jgi:hypothetical protein
MKGFAKYFFVFCCFFKNKYAMTSFTRFDVRVVDSSNIQQD